MGSFECVDEDKVGGFIHGIAKFSVLSFVALMSSRLYTGKFIEKYTVGAESEHPPMKNHVLCLCFVDFFSFLLETWTRRIVSKEGDNARQLPNVDVTKVDISPNPAPLCGSLRLTVDFTLDRPLQNAEWLIKYLVDSVHHRHVIELGTVPKSNYIHGENRFDFSVDSIDVNLIQPSHLTNCGLLVASLKDDQGVIMDLNMVVQVSVQDNILHRIVYSPLE
uniref:Uncharacterized protein AlNc14C10G1310 n=1 Tax=Albugo laibachii Nc14 TaxID=890382 RepID=F0W2S7_9STRA|nr:conserved unknown protein putative [Albugo laibachii Nc14]|eukprot:CCA15363.1 conserved unknown protein putative [Albugo laibachii Nc14]